MAINLPPITKSKPLMLTFIIAILSWGYRIVDAFGNAEFLLQKVGLSEDAAKFLGSTRNIDRLTVVSMFGLVLALLYTANRYLSKGVIVESASAVIADNSSGAGECRDKWLHDIARRQAEIIDYFLNVDSVLIKGHYLLGESPYIEFEITATNRSVFTLSVVELSGSIDYVRIPFDKPPVLRTNSMKNMENRWARSCTVKQPLSPKEAASILNTWGYFGFRQLDLRIIGAGDFKGIVQSQNLQLPEQVSAHSLQEAYPKLKVEFKQALIRDWYMGQGKGVAGSCMVNIEVRLTNLRERPISVQTFKLDSSNPAIGVRTAEEGEIFERPREPGPPNLGKSLPNLNRPPLRVENGQPVEGWVQFKFESVRPDVLQNSSQNLVIVDVSGEVHPIGCPKLQWPYREP